MNTFPLIAMALTFGTFAVAPQIRGREQAYVTPGFMPGILSLSFDLFAPQRASASAPKSPLPWKLVTNAFLRVNDGGPPKEWTAFQIEKKHDRVLLQMSDRVLFIDANRRQVFE